MRRDAAARPEQCGAQVRQPYLAEHEEALRLEVERDQCTRHRFHRQRWDPEPAAYSGLGLMKRGSRVGSLSREEGPEREEKTQRRKEKRREERREEA